MNNLPQRLHVNICRLPASSSSHNSQSSLALWHFALAVGAALLYVDQLQSGRVLVSYHFLWLCNTSIAVCLARKKYSHTSVRQTASNFFTYSEYEQLER